MLPAIFGEHYTIEHEIGRGGMAAVYRAHDKRHNRPVAVKVLDRELAASIGTARFLQEIETVAGLSHPNIVPMHDSGSQDGFLFYVMPHIEGKTLRQLIDADTRIPLEEVVRIATRIAAALDFAHRHGVVHRDIKPENIILFEGEPLILDFGIAKAVAAAGAERLTYTGIAIGTPAYLSPEQASGQLDVGGSSDQYSLACTVYEMIAGSPPFTGESPQSVIARRFIEKPKSLAGIVSVPHKFAEVVHRALSLEPADRFTTVTEFARALEDAITSTVEAPAEAKKPSVAVLPFSNISPDPDNEFFADGITEEIINLLTKVRALTVTSRTASFAFKGKTQDLDDIGRKLRVSNLLEGSVRKSGNRLRVSVQLLAAETGNTLWSNRYDRELADVFVIQDEIAANIVEALEVVLSGEEKAIARRAPTRNVRAYEFYLRGRQLYHHRQPAALAAAEEMFNRAIELDRDYALAYAGLSDTLGVLFGSFGAGPSALERAEAASARALELDPDLAEAHASRGLVLVYQKRLEEAEREFLRAIELDPTSYDAAYHFARMLATAGRVEESAAMFERAAALRPDDYQALTFVENMYFGTGHDDAAADAGRRAMAAIQRALAINPGDTRALSLGASTLLRLGDEAGGRKMLERVLALDPTNSIVANNAACFESIAGRAEAALDHLTRAVDLGFRNSAWLMYDPDVAGIRDHPRFKEQIERIEAAKKGVNG